MRFAAIPAGLVAIWSRVWIGPWTWPIVALVILWLVLNVRFFVPCGQPTHWTSRGICGERLRLQGLPLSPRNRTLNLGLICLGPITAGLSAWGLYRFDAVAVMAGGVILAVAQLIRLRLFARFYNDVSQAGTEDR